MGLMASQKNESSYPPMEAGSHHAICYGVIDIGTHETEYQGQKKRVHQIVLVFEIPAERITIEKDGKKLDLPRAISKTYTLSLSEKAKLYEHLIQWRGIPFTKEQLAGFDLFSIAGANCLLQVLNDVSGQGKPYAYIAGIMKLMKGMPKLKPENPICTYCIMDQGMNFPETLPEWIKEKIMASDEVKAMQNAANNPNLTTAQESFSDTSERIVDDEVPF